MRYVNRGVTACALVLAAVTAQADLVSEDSDFGTDTITLDTDTGLRWLDWSVTLGLSFDDVSAQLGPGGTYEGFRFATNAEVEALWQNGGIVDITTEGPIDFANDFTPANFTPAQDLIALLGTTGLNGDLSEGLTADASGGEQTVAELQVCRAMMFCTNFGAPGDSALASLGPNTQAADTPSNIIGAALVLDEVAADPIAGTAQGVSVIQTICRNLVSGQSVTAPSADGTSWDCSAAGLTGNAGERVLQIVVGVAACGGQPCDVGGSTTGVDGLITVCRNLTAGGSANAPLINGAWNCSDAGLAISSGDITLQVVVGSIPAAAQEARYH
ncbi:MAG: hypothetical protein AAGA68_04440 [Pseudomonadota bacterium]